jgi:hypothetical protein
MPDLKSELKKLEALRFDDEGTTTQEVTMQEPQTIGVSETVFNVIRDNPGCNRNRLVALSDTAGVSKNSSSSLINQFVKRGLVRTVESASGLTYFAVGQIYVRGYIKSNKKAAKVATPKAAKPAPQQQQDSSVQDLLNTMSIVKARALYDELKKIFGG